jgi:hypothetical protein
MEHVKRLVVAIVAVVVLGAGLSLLGEVRAASSVEGGKQALPSQKDVVGSWLVTYDVPAFGPPFPLLLSLGDEGVVIETDAPGAFPFGTVSVILSNGHGAWEPARGDGAFSYFYRKLIFQQNGLTPFGTARTLARGAVSDNGLTFRVTLQIQILAPAGQVLFETSGIAVGARIEVAEP